MDESIGSTFDRRVWELTARIPAGRVATYAAIARAMGTKGYRAVGGALNRNPHAPTIPCHRVVGSDGRLTGYAGGVDAKRRMLADEGVVFTRSGRVDLRSCGFAFDS